MLRSLLAIKESVYLNLISQIGIMSVFAFIYMLIASFCMFSTFSQLFLWFTPTSESAISSPVFSSNSCMPLIKPCVLLKNVPFSFLMTTSTSFSCLLGILAFLSAYAKVRTPIVVCADIGSAVRCFVLYSNCSPIFRKQS